MSDYTSNIISGTVALSRYVQVQAADISEYREFHIEGLHIDGNGLFDVKTNDVSNDLYKINDEHYHTALCNSETTAVVVFLSLHLVTFHKTNFSIFYLTTFHV